MTGQPGGRLTRQPADQAAGWPDSRVTRQPGNQVTRQPGNQVTRQPGNQVAGQPGGRMTGQPGGPEWDCAKRLAACGSVYDYKACINGRMDGICQSGRAGCREGLCGFAQGVCAGSPRGLCGCQGCCAGCREGLCNLSTRSRGPSGLTNIGFGVSLVPLIIKPPAGTMVAEKPAGSPDRRSGQGSRSRGGRA
jgi:hypothetical protein